MHDLQYRETMPTQTKKIKKIIRLSSKLNTSLEISKLLNRDHRTIKKFLSAGEVTHSKLKALSTRVLRKVTNSLRNYPHLYGRWFTKCP